MNWLTQVKTVIQERVRPRGGVSVPGPALLSLSARAGLPRPAKGSYRCTLHSAALSGSRQPSCLEPDRGRSETEETGDSGLQAAPGGLKSRRQPRRWSSILGYSLGPEKGRRRAAGGQKSGDCQTKIAGWGKGALLWRPGGAGSGLNRGCEPPRALSRQGSSGVMTMVTVGWDFVTCQLHGTPFLWQLSFGGTGRTRALRLGR